MGIIGIIIDHQSLMRLLVEMSHTHLHAGGKSLSCAHVSACHSRPIHVYHDTRANHAPARCSGYCI